MTAQPQKPPKAINLADQIYQQLKGEIFAFKLLPSDRFSEGELATRLGVSRTPIRQALYRLQQEGYVDVAFRSGWQVCPFDFAHFEALYDVRIVLEKEAVSRLCQQHLALPHAIHQLAAIWQVEPDQRLTDEQALADLDEQFHVQLVHAAGNPVMSQMHQQLTEKIRIIRRLDFTQPDRINATYQEHAQILSWIQQGNMLAAQHALQEHIQQSKSAVRQITLHRLQSARQA
ncbi:MAG: GntR family transcriptional regulator [Pseudomonadota bacterium]|nr:GntR family transcriptional regulator [Pseudomonadota bacterium]